MFFDVIDQYHSFVENNFIKANEEQIRVLKKINSIWNANKKTNLFSPIKKKDGVYLLRGINSIWLKF